MWVQEPGLPTLKTNPIDTENENTSRDREELRTGATDLRTPNERSLKNDSLQSTDSVKKAALWPTVMTCQHDILVQ